ncbi:hypothetical protein [Pelagibius sp.]|uniref:hypothetical protein n=1 Tax=Pelagibius sp. TaxID=1931238 RepID=UPI003B50A99A
MATILAHPASQSTPPALKRLPVFVDGGETYVGETQIISGAARIARGIFGPQAVLTAAVFTRRTRNQVLCLKGDTPPPEGLDLIGEARFATQSGDCGPVILRFAELAEPAEHRKRRHDVVFEPLGPKGAGLNGTFAFAGLLDFEDLLSLIVETVKGVHLAGPGAFDDLRFAGFRQTALPLGTAPMTAGKLTVRHLRVLSRSPRLRTVSRVQIEGPGGDSLAATVTFMR